MTMIPITNARLIQRRGDAEIPANGNWVLHRASFVGDSTLNHRLQLRVSDGVLKIAEAGRPSTLTIVAAQDGRWLRLVASTVTIGADRDGLSTWHLTGTVDGDGGRREVEVQLTYRGVRRRGDQAWAWFTGRVRRAATPPRLLRRRGELTIDLDLLFHGPLPSPAPVDESLRDFVVADESQDLEDVVSCPLRPAC
jgi:hypothetical protein